MGLKIMKGITEESARARQLDPESSGRLTLASRMKKIVGGGDALEIAQKVLGKTACSISGQLFDKSSRISVVRSGTQYRLVLHNLLSTAIARGWSCIKWTDNGFEREGAHLASSFQALIEDPVANAPIPTQELHVSQPESA